MFKTVFDALCEFGYNRYARACFTLCIIFRWYYYKHVSLIVEAPIAVFLFVFGIGNLCILIKCACKKDVEVTQNDK